MIKKKKGNTIIEVLIAATLIAVAILAALSLSSSSQKQTDYSRDLHLSSTYNDQSLDWLRNMRTIMGFASFVEAVQADGSGTVTYCLDTLPSTETEFINKIAQGCGASMIPGTNLIRTIQLTPSGSPTDTIYAKVTTSWSDGTHETIAETKITKW